MKALFSRCYALYDFYNNYDLSFIHILKWYNHWESEDCFTKGKLQCAVIQLVYMCCASTFCVFFFVFVQICSLFHLHAFSFVNFLCIPVTSILSASRESQWKTTWDWIVHYLFSFYDNVAPQLCNCVSLNHKIVRHLSVIFLFVIKQKFNNPRYCVCILWCVSSVVFSPL